MMGIGYSPDLGVTVRARARVRFLRKSGARKTVRETPEAMCESFLRNWVCPATGVSPLLRGPC